MAESMSDEELMAALNQTSVQDMSDDELLAALQLPEQPQNRMQQASSFGGDESVFGKAFEKIPGADVVSEFASGAVRGITEGVDFLTTDAFNAASNLVGSDVRAPRLTDAAQSIGAGREGFMKPGVAQQVVSTAGEFAPAVASMASQASGIPTAVDRIFANGIKGLESGSPQARAIAERLKTSPKLQATTEGVKRGDAAQAGVKLNQTGGVVKDKSLSKAATQGFDEGVLSSLRAGSVQDKKKLLRILDLRESGIKNVRRGMVDRASDVVGGSIKDRLNTVVDVNKRAGARIDREAKALAGKPLNFDSPIKNFFDEMGAEGVRLTDDGLDFSASRFEDVSGAERILKVISKRAERVMGSGDARQAHDLKKFIDEHVTYGKSTDGLSGKAESIVKGLRRNIDGLLDDNFEAYRKANEDYAETIEVINNLQSAAGKKIDLTGKNADKALGTLARTVMSNNRGRIELVNTLDDLETVANKFGGRFDDDMLLQALFVDELDTVFKPSARTSLAGDVAKSAVDTAADVATGNGIVGAVRAGSKFVGDKALGRNQENALKAIREFLEQ